MSVLICENPECHVAESEADVAGGAEAHPRCPRCRHKLIAECRRCHKPIRVSTDALCWACAAPYKLARPLPEALLPPG